MLINIETVPFLEKQTKFNILFLAYDMPKPLAINNLASMMILWCKIVHWSKWGKAHP